MTICRYCRHSEATRAYPEPTTPLYCWHHKATVQPEDTCEAWERSADAPKDESE